MESPNEPTGRFWRSAVGLIVCLVLARGVMYLCVLPPFEGWDEYQHVGYVQSIVETDRAAVLGETNVPRSLVAAAVALPHPDEVARVQMRGTGALGHGPYWERRERGAPPPSLRPDAPPIPLYQAQHASFAYRLAAPIFSGLGGVSNLRASVAGLRLVNVGLTAAAVAVVLATLRRALGSERDAALVGLALASHPLFLTNGVRVANDALGVFLAVAAVALGFGLSEGPSRSSLPLRALALGAVAGLAALAKATNYALLPFLGLTLLALAVSRRSRPRRVALAGLLVAVGFLAATQAEVRFNLGRFGSLTPMQEAVFNGRLGRSSGDLFRTASAIDWYRVGRLLWFREVFFAGGWSISRTHPTITRLHQFGLTIGLAGWAWLAIATIGRRIGGGSRPAGPTRARSAWAPLGWVALVGSYTAALGYHRVQSTLAWGASSTAPWYACPALPWFLALAVVGGLAWTSHPLVARLRGVVPLLIVTAGLTAEPVAVWGMMVETHSGGASGAEALARLAWLQPAALGTPTLLGAMVLEGVVVFALWRVWQRPDVSAGPTIFRGPRRLGVAEPGIARQPLGHDKAAGYGA